MRRDGGEVSLQTVLLTPVVLVLILVIVQAALWFHAVQLADGAADDAVTTAARYGASVGDGQQALTQFVGEAGGSLASGRVEQQGEVIVATVTLDVPLVVPGWPARVTRSARAALAAAWWTTWAVRPIRPHSVTNNSNTTNAGASRTSSSVTTAPPTTR